MNTLQLRLIAAALICASLAGINGQADDTQGIGALKWFCQLGDADGLEKVLCQNADLANGCDDYYYQEPFAPLHALVGDELHDQLSYEDCWQCMQVLLEYGADSNAQDEQGNTPLHCAVKKNNTYAVQLLLEWNASVDLRNNDGETPLHCALRNPDDAIIDLLLKSGADSMAQDEYGNTPLNDVIMYQNSQVMNLFYTHGLIAGSAQDYVDTEIYNAAVCGDTQKAYFLWWHAGADATMRMNDKDTPLHAAVENDHVDMVEMLVQKSGPNLMCGECGETPLHVASRMNNEPLMLILLQYGADETIKDNNGKTPVDLKGGAFIREWCESERPQYQYDSSEDEIINLDDVDADNQSDHNDCQEADADNEEAEIKRLMAIEIE